MDRLCGTRSRASRPAVGPRRDPPTLERFQSDPVEADANQEDSPTGHGTAAPDAAAGPPTLADVLPPGRGALGLLLAAAIFAVVAFGPLVTFEPEPTLEAEFEGVFFSPSDTSPGVVLLLAAWLLYRRRERLLRLPVVGSPLWLSGGLLLLAGAILAWAVFVDARDLRVLALMAAAMGFGALLGGRPAMRLLLLPTAFLAFAMPMPAPLLNAMLYQMQFATADFTGFLLHLFGTTAFVTGDQILREGDNFAIIETCSGVRITETLTMLTILMLDLFRRRTLHSAILLLLTPAVAFLCNAARAVTLILNPHADIAEIHTLQGIGMLLSGLIVLYALDGILGRVLPAKRSAGESPPPAAGGTGPWRLRLATAALSAFAAIATFLPPWNPPQYTPPPLTSLEFDRIGDRTSSELVVDRRFAGRIGLKRDLYRRYSGADGVVDLYTVVGSRGFRPRSVLFSKAVLPGSGWDVRDRGTIRLEPGGRDATWRFAVSGMRRYLVISWHEGAGGLLGESLRSFLGLDRSPLRLSGEGVVIRISTRMMAPDAENRARAEARLLRFYDALRPKLDTLHAVMRRDTT